MIYNHSYDALRNVQFRGKPRDMIYLGVELELEVDRGPQAKMPMDYTYPVGYRASCTCTECLQDYWRNHEGRTVAVRTDESVANKVVELLGEDFAIIKHDGSLGYGIEIVSAPASLVVHRKRWPKLFAEIDQHGLKAEPSCGMHVHVSKEPFDLEHLGLMPAFITEPANRKFVIDVAGREKPDWASMEKKIPAAAKHIECVNRYGNTCPECLANRELRITKYQAVNIGKPKTAEFRIFASTTDQHRFFTNLEFAASVARYCRNVLKPEAPDFRYQAYLAWLSNEDYPELKQFLTVNQYLPVPPVVPLPSNKRSVRLASAPLPA